MVSAPGVPCDAPPRTPEETRRCYRTTGSGETSQEEIPQEYISPAYVARGFSPTSAGYYRWVRVELAEFEDADCVASGRRARTNSRALLMAAGRSG